MVFAMAAETGVDVPPVFILAAAAPVAFHIITLSRVFGLRSDLVRLLIVVSTVVGGAALLAGIALTRQRFGVDPRAASCLRSRLGSPQAPRSTS